MQSPLVFIGKVASLTLASTLVLNSLGSLGNVKAATDKPSPAAPATTVEREQPIEVAQAITTLLLYDTGEFTVRVFRRGGGGPLQNVFDNARQVLVLDGQPATLRTVSGQDAYVSFGVFNGRQVEYASQVFDKPGDPAGGFARLLILQGIGGGETSVIRVEDAELVSIFNVPPGVGQGQSERDTIFFFETQSYAVRVFNRGGRRLMNVFNRFSSVQEVNGQVATYVPPTPPFEGVVSYVASGVRNGQSVQYYANYDACAPTAFLEIYNANGNRLLREPSVGIAEINIPPAELTPAQQACGGGGGGGGGDTGRLNDAYVAAVFGDAETLRQVQRLYPDAFLDNSARQGEFINAGSFSSEQAALIRVLELQEAGFNSRLVFRDVRFR